ncbi:MAG: lactonase family protein [Victivallaceae bacterium]|nr:lactonase family protein [Victivallaceae bacterium]
MKETFYVSAFSDGPQGGIYNCSFGTDGRVHTTGVAPLKGAGYLALSRTGKWLLATCFFDEEEDGVALFAVGDDGLPVLRGIASSGGRGCCHVGFSPDEKFAYAANYRSGSFAEFSVNATKIERTRLVVHEGRGAHLQRQDAPHVHFTQSTPDDRYVAVVDLGLDRIDCHRFEPEKGIAPGSKASTVISPAGSGPRHLVFAGASRAYLVNELGNSVMVLDYKEGRFSVVATVPTLPFDTDCSVSKAGAIRLSGDGGTLAVSNRGIDTLAFFSLKGDGIPERRQFCYCGGKSPRDIAFLSGGRFASANEYSDKVCFFRLTPQGYEPDGNELMLPRPLCILPR